MSRSTNAIKLLAKAGITASRSSEAVSVLPEMLHIATDPNDDLYCPEAELPPSPGLVQSMRNGWMEGSIIVCTNRGTKEAPIPYIAEGRSRKKAAEIVNIERKTEGLDPIRVDIVFCSPEDAYAIMLLGNNRQERSPLFNARRWQQHKRVVARRLGKVSLNDAERTEARKEFASLIDCSESAIAGWETALEAPPEVLAMVERGDIGMTDAKEIVKKVPEAQRTEKAAEIAARNSESNGEPKRTKKAHREAVLGKGPSLTPRQIRALTVAANGLGSECDYSSVDESMHAAVFDGFAFFGKLVTGEIKVDDLPAFLRDMAREVLNKK